MGVSIHAPHEGERPPLSTKNRQVVTVSIHAPHEGERRVWLVGNSARDGVSIHAPHEGERRGRWVSLCCRHRFQSTLPTRGSDFCIFQRQHIAVDVSIHAPHEGERHIIYLWWGFKPKFQSTLPTRGSDYLFTRQADRQDGFNPRSPRGGATATALAVGACSGGFNPRSPRGGATGRQPLVLAIIIDVSIHAPHEGERLSCRCCNTHRQAFQSTLPTRGSDLGGYLSPFLHHLMFQSTLPTRGSDRMAYRFAQNAAKFQSTLPTRGSDIDSAQSWHDMIVSIHAPHEGERLNDFALKIAVHLVSIHAPHEGERHIPTANVIWATVVSIHAPHEGERRLCSLNGRRRLLFQSTLPTRGSDNYLC